MSNYAAMTDKELRAYVESKIKSDRVWATKALLAIYAHQTADEQRSESTKEDNGIGFNGLDAQWYSKLAKEHANSTINAGLHKYLTTPKGKNRRLLKYVGQLVRIIRSKQQHEEPAAEMEGEELRAQEERFAISGAYQRALSTG